MRKAVMPFVLSVGLIAVWAAPADAASTRAEYISQVDPICQSFVGPEHAAFRAYIRNDKREVHLARSGTLKAWLKATRRTSHSLVRFAQIDASLIEQVAAVSPPAADAGTVGTWLNYRRQANVHTASAAAALNRPVPEIGKYFKRAKQANAAVEAAGRAIEGFGFQVCEVSV
jgi:hypothetical protein